MSTTILIMETSSNSLRGFLTRWFLEIKPGVMIGNVSAAVRKEVQDLIAARDDYKGAIIISSAKTEQGFKIWTAGDPERYPTDHDGLILITRKISSS